MEIKTVKNDGTLVVGIKGRLDTMTAPELEKKIHEEQSDITNLVLDMKEMEYISSAGLRVILAAQKQMNAINGTLTLKNVCDDVMEVFDMTGFSDFLTIE